MVSPFALGTSQDLRQGIGSFGAAADKLFASKGYEISAAGYRQAASISRKNEEYSIMSTDIRRQMAEREATKTIGGQQADVAAAGFAASGSALDILRASQQEAALTQTIIDTQGEIDLNTYKMQTLSYNIQADAAEAAGERSKLGALIDGISGLVSFAGFLGGK